jgi:hypothetical protein
MRDYIRLTETDKRKLIVRKDAVVYVYELNKGAAYDSGARSVVEFVSTSYESIHELIVIETVERVQELLGA